MPAAAALALFAATRLVALPEPLGIDQGIFATAGWGLTRGLTLYRDVWDQKPPGIHVTYALAFLLTGPTPRVALYLDILAWTLAVAALFAIAARLGSRAVAWWAAGIFAVCTYPAFARAYGGFLERAVAETFISASIAGAAWAAIGSATAGRRRAAADVAAGLLVGAAAVYKPTAFVYWPALLLFMWWQRRAAAWAFALRSGLALPIPWLVTAAWLWHAHALGDAWVAIVEYNRAYVAAGAGWLELPNRLLHEVWRLVKTDPLWLLAAVGGVTAVAATVRRRQAPAVPLLATLWLAAAMIAVAANGVRMYATYFLPAACPLALLAAWWLPGLTSARARAGAALALMLAAGVAVRSHYPDRLARFAAADLSEARQAHPSPGYLELFGGYNNGRGYSARANDELAAYLADHTGAEDRIYIFGMAPSVYLLSRRLPANRFVWTYPGVVNLVHRDGFTREALARDLERAAPAYIVLERNNRDSASGWRIEDEYGSAPIRALLAGYARETTIEDFTVLRRR